MVPRVTPFWTLNYRTPGPISEPGQVMHAFNGRLTADLYIQLSKFWNRSQFKRINAPKAFRSFARNRS